MLAEAHFGHRLPNYGLDFSSWTRVFSVSQTPTICQCLFRTQCEDTAVTVALTDFSGKTDHSKCISEVGKCSGQRQQGTGRVLGWRSI